VGERTGRLVLGHEYEHSSRLAAIKSVGADVHQTILEWIK
jgi:hypothetical protein